MDQTPASSPGPLLESTGQARLAGRDRGSEIRGATHLGRPAGKFRLTVISVQSGQSCKTPHFYKLVNFIACLTRFDDLVHVGNHILARLQGRRLVGGFDSVAKSKKADKKSDKKVTLNRRAAKDRREASTERREKKDPVANQRRKIARRVKVQRRRQIDPTTCERDYTDDELEFMNAIDKYKRTSGRMFPTCSEMLEVLRDLGYEKRSVVAESEMAGASLSEG